MNDKEMTYIGEFIKHNNIHQTIESLMFGTHLISILLILIYLRFAISPPDKADPIALYISLCIPVMLLVVSILLRKRIFYLKEKEFGKSLYIVQITIYIYCLIIGILFVTLVVLCEYGAKKVPRAIAFTILVAGVTVASTYVRVKLNIKRGHYLHRKNIINEKNNCVYFLSDRDSNMYNYFSIYQNEFYGNWIWNYVNYASNGIFSSITYILS